MTPEIYNIDNYTFALILIVGGSVMFILRKITGTAFRKHADENENALRDLSYGRRDGRMLIVLGFIFLPLSFLYALYIKQPEVDRLKGPVGAPSIESSKPSEP